jgi:hypothetical protein
MDDLTMILLFLLCLVTFYGTIIVTVNWYLKSGWARWYVHKCGYYTEYYYLKFDGGSGKYPCPQCGQPVKAADVTEKIGRATWPFGMEWTNQND